MTAVAVAVDSPIQIQTTPNTGVLATRAPQSQEDVEPWGYYPEIYIRKAEITTAMPIYPTDAVERGITGVVQARILINNQGEVTQIKINPHIDTSLKQATADAVSKWTFKFKPYALGPGRSYLSRLSFKFSINDSGPFVELYDPGPDAKGLEHLGHTDTMRELFDWKRWEEVKPTRSIMVKE
jgi:TonB family protein